MKPLVNPEHQQVESCPQSRENQRKIGRALCRHHILHKNQGEFFPFIEFNYMFSGLQITLKTDARRRIVHERHPTGGDAVNQLTDLRERDAAIKLTDLRKPKFAKTLMLDPIHVLISDMH